MSFWKKLFGGSSAPAPGKTAEFKGFIIEAQPYKDGSQYQLAGMISKNGKSHRFVRADKFSSMEEAADFALVKGRLIIDEQGEKIFG